MALGGAPKLSWQRLPESGGSAGAMGSEGTVSVYRATRNGRGGCKRLERGLQGCKNKHRLKITRQRSDSAV